MSPSPAAPSKFSLSLNSKKPAASSTTKTKRPHSALQDSDDEDNGAAAGRTEEVSHFDLAAGGAIDASKGGEGKRGPLVIQSLGNRDWREESQRKRQRSNLLPAEAQAALKNGGVGDQTDELNKGPERFGLLVVEKGDGGGGEGDGAADELVEEVPEAPKTDDQRALEALLGEKSKSNTVIPVASEEEAFHRDYENAPDMATLEDYAAVPVEEFGAALLRGMGWKEGEAIGRRKGQKAVQPRVLERRPALLGIGAKSEAAIGIELGTWGKEGKGKAGGARRKTEQAYNPVLLKNKETGEMVTEEELKTKMERQKMEEMEAQQLSKSRRESPARIDDSQRRSHKTNSSRRMYDDDFDSDARDKDRRRREKGDYRDKDHRDRDYDRDSKYRSSRRDRSASVDQSDRRRRRDRDDRDRRDDRRDERKYRNDDDRYRKGSSRREYRDRDSVRERDSGRDSSDRHRRR
ncbi:hypothetical protein K490DRAFT_61989 [Saccharata proteae CBS 121410]|uniref:Pre-mRNA-splicing factor n=1 Tax=Saccharata proteae CBS 121410 TaxID=1314787 RepID=A0A9P4HWT0_9PEZI|nr:hypothetical protein K490DRAFT_61989 [Saccharata proteae CBS 121410]